MNHPSTTEMYSQARDVKATTTQTLMVGPACFGAYHNKLSIGLFDFWLSMRSATVVTTDVVSAANHLFTA